MLDTALETAQICGIPNSSVFIFDVQDQKNNHDIQSWEGLPKHGKSDWVKVDDPSKTVASYCILQRAAQGLPKAAMIPHTYLFSQVTLRRSPPCLPYKVSAQNTASPQKQYSRGISRYNLRLMLILSSPSPSSASHNSMSSIHP